MSPTPILRVDLRADWDRRLSVAESIRRSWSAALVSLFHAIQRKIAGLSPLRASGSQSAVATAYDALAEATGDLILHLDSTGEVLSVACAAREASGWDAGALTGRGLFDRVHAGDYLAFSSAIGEALHREETICVQLRLRGGSKSDPSHAPDIFFRAKMRMRRLASSSAIGGEVICIVRRIAESPAERNVATREDAGGEATYKDRLLADVSHELRTPLNAIIGFSEILSAAELAPRDAAKQLEYARIIHASAEHLLSVVNLLLDSPRTEAKRFAIAPERFEMAPLIASCCDMLRLKAREGGVALIQPQIDVPAEIVADKRACRQIMINLLSNAVKFTRPGGRVTVGSSVEGDSLLIHVEDTGIGIASSHFSKLGNPYFQVRSSHETAFEGTGLGLSLVRGLVGLHGGALSLESVVEEGTRIVVRLPLDCRGKTSTSRAPAPIEVMPSLTRMPAAPFARASLSHRSLKEKKIA
jgi:two-component system, cell cycle sensor histidine kinase DivJ